MRMGLKTPRVRRHSSIESLVRKFFGRAAKGARVSDWELSDTGVSMAESIRAMGYWGFSSARLNEIHYWSSPSTSFACLRFFFAHELGHIADHHAKNKFSRGYVNGERRADLYGWVAELADCFARMARRRSK